MNICVNFIDREWEKLDGCCEIEYRGRKYRAVNIPVMEDGKATCVPVAEVALARAMEANGELANNLDDLIGYYAAPHQRAYEILAGYYDIDKPQYSAMARND